MKSGWRVRENPPPYPPPFRRVAGVVGQPVTVREISVNRALSQWSTAEYAVSSGAKVTVLVPKRFFIKSRQLRSPVRCPYRVTFVFLTESKPPRHRQGHGREKDVQLPVGIQKHHTGQLCAIVACSCADEVPLSWDHDVGVQNLHVARGVGCVVLDANRVGGSSGQNCEIHPTYCEVKEGNDCLMQSVHLLSNVGRGINAHDAVVLLYGVVFLNRLRWRTTNHEVFVGRFLPQIAPISRCTASEHWQAN